MHHLCLFHSNRCWNDEPNQIPPGDVHDADDAADSLSPRNAFEIGESLGLHRMNSDEWISEDMERGYRYGSARPATHADVFQRKILQARRNAFNRSIPFSRKITRGYLRRINVDVCPVSGAELTHATRTESDWSLDRLDNQLGYVPGNVCVVASRVNSLKFTDSFQELATAAWDALQREGHIGLASEVDSGLFAIEALRIAALAAGPSAMNAGAVPRYLPLAMAPDVIATFEAGIAGMHVGCARTRLEGRAAVRRRELFRPLGDSTWRLSNRLVSLIRTGLSRGVHPCDIWLDGGATQVLCDLTSAFLGSAPDTYDIDIPGDELLIADMSKSLANFQGFRRHIRR